MNWDEWDEGQSGMRVTEWDEGHILQFNNCQSAEGGSAQDVARRLRFEKAGGWYHITARGNERKAIFRDDRDRRHFLEVCRSSEERSDCGKRYRDWRPVIAAVERVKGQKGDEFRDRHRDRGRDMVLYLRRWVCGMKLTELAQAVGLLNYAVVATSAK
jgi:hypothetical protein